MTEKQCAICGELSPSGSNFCSSCGSNEFRDIPPQLAARLADGPDRVLSSRVRISTERIILVTALSAGLYVVYWFYLTWKQLDSETDEDHYPIWHAVTLLVPIYNLFRMHEHVRVIGELAARQGVTAVIAPFLAVVLLIVSNSLGWSSLGIDDSGVLIFLGVLSTTVTATLIVAVQRVLNLYWERARPPDAITDARVGVGEVVIVVLGILLWIAIFSPA